MRKFLDQPTKPSLSLRERKGNVVITPDNYHILPPSSHHIYKEVTTLFASEPSFGPFLLVDQMNALIICHMEDIASTKVSRRFEPGPRSIGVVAEREIRCIHQTLSSLVQAQSIPHLVQGIAKRHLGFWVCKTKKAS